jgi:hypothetical protein
MLRLSEISEDTALFPWNKSTPYPAVESTVAVAVALALGEITGHPSAGSIAAGAAFTVGFAVFHEALSSTILSMALLTLGIASATLAGSLGAQSTVLVLFLCVLAAFNYGVLAGLDATANWIAQQCGVFVVVSSYFANGAHYALGRSAMVLTGGVLQMIVFTVSRFVHRYARPDSPAPPPVLRQIRTRAGQLWTCFLAEARWKASTNGYVIRLSVTLLLSTALYRGFHWRNGYWAPMTALLVLKPKWANTLSRGIARLTGTLAGAALCAFLATFHAPFHHWTYFVLIIVTAYLCFALQAVNYALFSAILTTYTVFLFAFGGFSERSAADLRLVNTAVGGVLALLVDYVATQLPSRGESSPKPAPAATAAS